MSRFERINKNKVKAEIKKNGVWKGLMVGNKVNEFHFIDGWHLASHVEFHSLEELDKTVNSFMYYLDRSLGSAPAFYIEGGRQ